MNNITITGNLGKDVEVRFTKSGKPVSSLTVAHTPREKVNNEWQDGETLWFKVTVWEELPDVMFAKGVKVIVTGALKKETYEKDGQQRETLAITADTIGIVYRPQVQQENNFKPTATPSVNDETPF